MRLLDNAIAAFSPERALRRQVARVNLAALQKRYDAAQSGPRMSSHATKRGSANAVIAPSLATVRDRVRDLARNSPHVAHILDVLPGHIVGTGILAIPETDSDQVNKDLCDLYSQFSDECDQTGEHDFEGQQELLVRSMIEGGDSALRFIPLSASSGQALPLGTQIIEGDQIDHLRNGVVNATNVRMGVALGENDRRTGYYLHRHHPSELVSGQSYQSDLVPKRDVCHMMRATRIGQVRGISWLAPIVLSARDYEDIAESVRIRMRTEACFSAFITEGDGGSLPDMTKSEKDAPYELSEELSPGTIQRLKPGDGVAFANPSSSGQFDPIMVSTLQAMAVGCGLAYDQVSGDFRRANFSSLKAGRIDFRRLVEQIQWNVVIRRLVRPVYERFFDYVLISGKTKATADMKRAVRYQTPAIEPLDPLKELQADILMVRAGAMTPQEFMSKHGYDYRDNLKDFQAFNEMADPAGLAFDIDGRRPSHGGAIEVSRDEQQTEN